MHVIYLCNDHDNETVNEEMASLYGMRYNRNGFAILSTEHKNHDYLLPMTKERFQAFIAEFREMLKTEAGACEITGGQVYRVRRGAILHVERLMHPVYHVEALK